MGRNRGETVNRLEVSIPVKSGPRGFVDTRDLARISGQSARTIRRYLAEAFPEHHERACWRFDEKQGEAILLDLANAGVKRRFGLRRKPKRRAAAVQLPLFGD